MGPLRELGFDPKFHLVPIEDKSMKYVSMGFDVDDIRAIVLAITEGQQDHGQ